ncbi:FkbM family methyltransferase [Roseixanthobacter glucoisosaccharinicivorans]|uniref:FkbM family methyltransferase n=1 Tax=Roseixanthobacter glucoisosaccharinicivorans TaxID=3119923 RepID=UPI0037296C1E
MKSDNLMLLIAFTRDFLGRVDDACANGWMRNAERLSGEKALLLNAQDSLPTLSHGQTLLLFADSGRGAGVLRVHLGGEVREPGVVWARDIEAVNRLLATPISSGIYELLIAGTSERVKNYTQNRYAEEIRRLEEKNSAYVFGAKRLGEVVVGGLRLLGLDVAGVVDNNSKLWGSHLGGTVIQGVADDLDRSVPVVIGTTRFPFTLTKQLKSAGFEVVIPYSVMNVLDSAAFPDEIPYINNQDDIAVHRENYISEYLNYEDEKSRAVMNALLLYRLTLDPIYIQGNFESESDQYFDKDLVSFSQSEVFVDAGGFDAQTTKWFVERVHGVFRKIYYFEPDPRLMAVSQNVLAPFRDIEFVQAGVFDEDGTARFVSTGTVNGAVSTDPSAGDMSIDVKKIDSVAMLPVSFIKMDVEGMEAEGLRGARGQIREHAPTLAIACYHRGEHIWELGRLIRDLNPTYRLNLRHYTEGGLETVIYAYSEKSQN